MSQGLKQPLRMGRISFLNVLPIYHPLETGILPHDFELVSGTPAFLNKLMCEGQLQISSCSCIEYARNSDKYYLVRDLSIGSRGPVMSVLLLSKVPVEQLSGKEILISGQSHTSVALLKILLSQLYGISSTFRVGSILAALNFQEAPIAFLAIGDEALRLRNHPQYSYCIDLAEAWREWTGLPFIFGLWIIDRNAVHQNLFREDPGELLRKGRDWGLANIQKIVSITTHGCPLSREELLRYYTEGLLYSLGQEEIRGLELFYEKLVENGLSESVPELNFY